MSGPQVLLEGLVFPESPRWRDGRLWLSDWGAREILAVDVAGGRETIVAAPSFPPAPGSIVLITEDGSARLVADGIEFPNGSPS